MDQAAFWEIMALPDWQQPDEDDALLPIIEALAVMDDQEFFAFDDLLAKLLYDTDGPAWARAIYGEDLQQMSAEGFLYARCAAVALGRETYTAFQEHRMPVTPDAKYEVILYVAPIAWAVKHDADVEDYPHTPPYEAETGSNTRLWQAD